MSQVSQDAVVEANRELLLERSNRGIAKYGTTLQNSKLDRRDLLQHALEEALDLANYLQAEIMRLDAEQTLAAAEASEKERSRRFCRICKSRPVHPPFDHCGTPQCIPF